MKEGVFFVLMICTLSLHAQIDSVAVRMERIKAAETDSCRLKWADEIPEYLRKIEFGKYPVLAQVKFLGYRRCVNEEAEMFSWTVPLKEGLAYYTWFSLKEGNRKGYLLKYLPGGKEEEVGWLFYDLVAFRSDGETYYALLGWRKTGKTNQKIVRIARFKRNGTMSFNHSLLQKGNGRSASLAFEYAGDGSMMLKQDKKGKRIIFDHLAPNNPKYKGYFMFYGPDGSYDALVLKGGRWQYQENVKQ